MKLMSITASSLSRGVMTQLNAETQTNDLKAVFGVLFILANTKIFFDIVRPLRGAEWG